MASNRTLMLVPFAPLEDPVNISKLTLTSRTDMPAPYRVTTSRPTSNALNREAIERYQVEPYVIAADVYSEPPLVCHGGWP